MPLLTSSRGLPAADAATDLLARAGSVSSTAASAAVTSVASRIAPEHLAMTRTAIGVSMVARPRLLPKLFGIDSATSARMGWSTQMLGAREVALGVGALVALRTQNPRTARLWLAMGLLSDAADALVVTGALLRKRVSRPVGLAAVVTALAAVAAGAQALDEDEDDQ